MSKQTIASKPGHTLMVAVFDEVFNLDDGENYKKGETFFVKSERANYIPDWVAVPATAKDQVKDQAQAEAANAKEN